MIPGCSRFLFYSGRSPDLHGNNAQSASCRSAERAPRALRLRAQLAIAILISPVVSP